MESYLNYYYVKIELPNGTFKKFNEKLNSHKAIFDLYIELCAKYKLQPSNFKLNLYDNQQELINYGPNRSLDHFKPNSIEIVPKKLAINKQLNDEPSNKFDVTIRVQVDLPHNQKTAVRVSPNIKLKQLYQFICKENSLNESDYRLKLKNFELNNDDFHTKLLSDFNTNQVELVFINSSYNSSPLSIKNGIKGSSLSIYDDINSIASHKTSKSIFSIFKKRAKLQPAASKTSLNLVENMTPTTFNQKQQEFAFKKKKQAPPPPTNPQLPLVPKNSPKSNEQLKLKEPILLLNTKKKFAPIAPPLVQQKNENENITQTVETLTNTDNDGSDDVLKSNNSSINDVNLSLIIEKSDQKVPSSTETSSSSAQNDDSTQADCSDMADFPPPPEIPLVEQYVDEITQDTSQVLHELDFLDDERTIKSDDSIEEDSNSLITSEIDTLYSCIRDPIQNVHIPLEKHDKLVSEVYHISKVDNISIVESELVSKIESNLTINEHDAVRISTRSQKEEEKSYRVIHSAEVIEKDGAYISLDGTVRGFPGAVKKIATSRVLNDLFSSKNPTIESPKKILTESMSLPQSKLVHAIESEKKDVDKANLKNFLNNHLSKKLELINNNTNKQQQSVIKQSSAFVISAKNKASNLVNGSQVPSTRSTTSTYI